MAEKSFRKPKLKKLPKSIHRIRKKIGDIIEVPTLKGLAYVQYTHEHISFPRYGSLVRALEGLYEKRPAEREIAIIVSKPHRFQIFCPVYRVVNIGDWERIGNFPVPKFAQKFPTFKNTNALPNKNPTENIWSLWDGKSSWKVGRLSLEEQMKHPRLSVTNDTGLIQAIETGRGPGGFEKLC